MEREEVAVWQEVNIQINRTALEGAYAVLDQWGIQSYAVTDPELIHEAREAKWGDYFPETIVSPQVTISCYFSGEQLGQTEQARLQQDLQGLAEFGFDPGAVVIKTKNIAEEDWAHAWKAHYHPLKIGRVWIQPSWEELKDTIAENDLVIHLDPGMAFGSGTHPSTAMCVEFLQELKLTGREVWDVGTGSGILAITAAKLGADVQAVDIDPVAVQVAKENRDRNGAAFPIRQGSLEDLTGNPQIIVANIVAQVIAPMLPTVQRILTPGGFFIAAGVIEGRDQEILSLARSAGLRLLRRVQKGEWVGYLFQRGD